MADELVRVRIKSGNKVRLRNMGRALAEASDVEILEGEPTRQGDGRLLPETTESGRPPKPPTTVADQATAKKAAAVAATDTAKEARST